jgi:hypothetical protein
MSVFTISDYLHFDDPAPLDDNTLGKSDDTHNLHQESRLVPKEKLEQRSEPVYLELIQLTGVVKTNFEIGQNQTLGDGLAKETNELVLAARKLCSTPQVSEISSAEVEIENDRDTNLSSNPLGVQSLPLPRKRRF